MIVLEAGPVIFSATSALDVALWIFTHEDTTGLLSSQYLNLVISRLAVVREAVGPNVDILMENHSYLDAQSAVQLGRLVENRMSVK